MPKEKVTLYLEPEMKAWLESQVDEEQKVSAVVRNLIRKAMKLKSRKKQITTVNDPFSFYTITADLIPDDLKEYSELLIEWWPVRKQKGGSCTTSVANRIFKTLRSFPSQDRKEALEKAITGGWKDISTHLRRVTNQKNLKIIQIRKYSKLVMLIFHQHLLN